MCVCVGVTTFFVLSSNSSLIMCYDVCVFVVESFCWCENMSHVVSTSSLFNVFGVCVCVCVFVCVCVCVCVCVLV